MHKVILFLGLILLSASALAGDTRSEIEARNQAFADAFNRGDLAGVTAIYGDGFSVVPNGGEEVTDRAGLEEVLGSFMATASELRFETLAVDPWSEYVYELGKAHFLAAEENGEKTPAAVSYLVIWKKGEDGAWYIQVDAWWEAD